MSGAQAGALAVAVVALLLPLLLGTALVRALAGPALRDALGLAGERALGEWTGGN